MSDVRTIDPAEPALWISRELSLLEFNRRVLAQARDASTPLLERLRFLTICSTNLDEFFEIRVASHRERAAFGTAQVDPDGRTSLDTLTAISQTAHGLVDEQYRVLNEVLVPELDTQGIRVLRRADWSDTLRSWIKGYFQSDVKPVLTPMGLDPAHPFPKILNKSLNFVVMVEGEDAYGRRSGIAVVQVPRALPRVIEVPERLKTARHEYVLLSSVIHEHIGDLFPGMSVAGCYQFRVTRDGDLWVDEEEVDDLLKALEGELPERKYAAAVRLEVTRECPDHVARFLLGMFELPDRDLYRVNGPVNLNRLAALHQLVDRPDLKYPPFVPKIPRTIDRAESIFEVLKRGDILLHHPYESFIPVLELVRQAASDPDVLAIKQTLYRVGSQSPVVDALIEAARAGKEVVVVVELRARFDEAENIDLATRLQEVGAKVVYGIVGYKTHAKMLLVVRREGNELRRYVHLGTGNYHTGTARAYTDLSLLTARPEYGEDADKIFLQLTGLGRVRELEKVLQSPFTLQKKLVQLIDQEAENARAGKPSRIVAKMNALTMPEMVRALYRASQAGVPIDLIVRGACCLRPGVPGVSENIRVRSIIGRFLEHSRVFHFLAGGAELTFCSSADWMTRNLARRVEVGFPIEDPVLKLRVVRECFDTYLADDLQAWLLESSGTYAPAPAHAGAAPRAAQKILLDQLSTPDDLERLTDPTEGTSSDGGLDDPGRMRTQAIQRDFLSQHPSDFVERRRKDEHSGAALKGDGKSKKHRKR